jgi:dipeptidyl aminopeptidase/acylaminoacyl peptidase
MARRTAPYGSWASPLTAGLIAGGATNLTGVGASDGRLYWSELRPSEGGRSAIMRLEADGSAAELTPAEFNVRTQVHEYGGGAWWLHGSTLFFTNWNDQRLYRQDPGAAPVPITPEPGIPRGLRYADGVVSSDGRTVICVRERHVEGREAFNEIVILPADGSVEPDDIVSGADFYSTPRLSPDGTKLAWLEWRHPNLPWDGTFLYVCDLTPEFGIRNATLVAGGMDESIFQPQWSPDGVLHFVSDRSAWWNLYRYLDGRVEQVVDLDADFGVPQWAFGSSTYAFVGGDIVCVYVRNATSQLARITNGSSVVEDIDTPFTSMSQVTTFGDRVALIAASPTEFGAVVTVDPATGGHDVVKRSRTDAVDGAYLSVPEAIDFDSESRVAHAFFYAPASADFEGPSGEKPPLVVFSHGGPTGNVTSALNLSIQFWTSRGFAVVDVNYGGSTGYGRDYRRLLNGQWGVVDVEDCVNAARYLVARGDVDGDRLAVRGGSAGGFTTLAALVFTDVFKAGANYFGVSDFTPFVEDTHKFESRYLDSLVGPYPEMKDLYYERSPANFVERITAPVITFQGTEDAIVPPSQSERVVEALRANKIPCAYVTYEGEQHGFRKAENIVHSLESELYFYGRVFGFEPADEIAAVEIENL